MSSVGRAIKEARARHLLFRNKDYVAINKPMGVSLTGGKEPSGAIREIFSSMGMTDIHPIPVSTMDARVSGVALFSLHSTAGRLARTMIREGKFWRCKYWGLVGGRVAGGHSSGIVNMPLRDAVPWPDGTASITHWKLLRYAESDRVSLIEFEPRTDVPNQIRIHCDVSLRTPLVDEAGLHLHKVIGCLPGGDDIEVVAPAIGEFHDSLEKLGFI